MRKPSILYLVHLPPPIHGASEMSRMVVDSDIVNAGFEKKVIQLNFSNSLKDLQRFTVLKIFKAVGIFFQLGYALAAFRPTIVYFTMIPFGPLLFRDGIYLLLIRLFGAKPVIHLHRPGLDSVSPSRLNRFIYQNLFHNCRIIHLSSLLVERELIPLGLSRSNLFSFPNTVDFNPTFSPVREKVTSILFFSNLYPHKGFFNLMKAFAIIADQYPEMTLTIAGYSPDPTIPSRIRELAESLHLQHRIIYLGGVEKAQRAAVYANADIFVLPSESEYFPLVILEAMLAGVPVICTGAENIGCYFKDTVDLFFLSSHPSVGEIADKLQYAIDNYLQRIDMANSAYSQTSKMNGEGLKQLRTLFMECCSLNYLPSQDL